MIPIIGEQKPEFIIGSKIKTTPKYNNLFKKNKEGEVCKINGNLITFYSEGGKDTIHINWIIKA